MAVEHIKLGMSDTNRVDAKTCNVCSCCGDAAPVLQLWLR